MSSRGKTSGALKKEKREKTAAERIATLYKSIVAQLDGGHFQNALKNCDRILRLDSDDIDALETKLYVLLQLEQYREALNLLLHPRLNLPFEKAYCLYRTHERSEAYSLLQELQEKLGSKQRGLQHLEAQLKYRDTAYEQCVALYTQLLDAASSDSEEKDDILNNLHAAQSYVDFMKSGYQQAMQELNLDITRLEASAPPMHVAPTMSNVVIPPAQPAARHQRKSRIPKHVVPGITPPPDPERWLKKRDRTRDVRRTKKARKEGMGAGSTQGIAVGTAMAPSAVGTSAGTSKKRRKQAR